MEPSDSRRPFHPLVNVGLVIRTTGNCVFGAFKVLKIISQYILLVFLMVDLNNCDDFQGALVGV